MPKSSAGNHRSAKTGQFTKAGKAAGNRAGHQTEPRGKSGDGQVHPTAAPAVAGS